MKDVEETVTAADTEVMDTIACVDDLAALEEEGVPEMIESVGSLSLVGSLNDAPGGTSTAVDEVKTDWKVPEVATASKELEDISGEMTEAVGSLSLFGSLNETPGGTSTAVDEVETGWIDEYEVKIDVLDVCLELDIELFEKMNEIDVREVILDSLDSLSMDDE